MKKLFSFLIISLASLPLIAQTTVFFDDFTSNAKDWLQSTSGNSIYVINNGKMIMENTTETATWLGKDAFIGNGKDFSISLSASHTSGVENYGFGLYFGASDGNNGYSLQISANGYYIFIKYQDGKLTNLVDWTKSTYVNAGNYANNELMVKQESGSWKLYVNNNYLTSVTAQTFFGNKTGFSISNKQRVEFDNLTVKEYASSSVNNNSYNNNNTGGGNTFKDLFSDDFYSNSNAWPIGQQETYSIAISNGKFIIDGFKTDKNYGSFRKIELDQSKDFTLAVSVMHTSGVETYGFGLIFGLTDMDNSYRFTVTSDGYYTLNKYENGTFSKLIDYTQNANVNKGNYATNDLMLKKTGSTWNLYINNQWVNSYTAQPFYGSKFGMYVANQQRVEFDNLKISGYPANGSGNGNGNGSNIPPADPLTYNNNNSNNNNSNNNNNTSTVTIPDFTGGTKITESGKLCDIFPKITREGSDRFKKFTGSLSSETKYTKVHASTITVSEATKAYIEHGSSYSTFRIDFGEYKTIAEAEARIEQIKPLLEKCSSSYKIVKSAGSALYGSTYYLTEKLSTGFRRTGYYLSPLSHTENGTTTYTATLSIPDKVYPDTYTYLTNNPVNSDFSKNLKYLMQEAKTNFDKIKGDKINTGEKESYYYKTTYTIPGAGYCELEDLWGVLDYDAYFGTRIGSEQAAKLAFNDLIKKVKDALGKNYMFTESNYTNTDTYTFYQKDNFYSSADMIEVELYKGDDGTYDVLLIVVGTADDDDSWF